MIDHIDFQHAQGDSVLLNPKLPHIAIEALRRGFLDPLHGKKQVATIVMFWSTLQHHKGPANLETISVFDTRADKLIKQGHLTKKI